MQDTARAAYQRDIAAELRQPFNAWILDDAVLGCLTQHVVDEFLGDFGLDGANTVHNGIFARALNEVLREGF